MTMKNTYYVINDDLKTDRLIDSYVSLIWNESYREAGDFELYIEATKDNVEYYTKAVKDHYCIIKLPSEPMTRFDPNFVSCMLIQNLNIEYDFENGNKIVISGRSAKYLLSKRVTLAPKSMAGNIQTELEQLVRENCVSPENVNRILPKLDIISIGDVITDVTDYGSGGENIYDMCVNACSNLEVGWDIMFDTRNRRFVFFVYKGRDLTRKVIFAPQFDNLLSTGYKIETDKSKNVAITYYKHQRLNAAKTDIIEENKYLETTSFRQSSSYSGYDRNELFIENSNAVNGEDASDIIANVYQMTTDAKTQLKDREYKPEFSGQVITAIGFTFVKDYNLGDIVKIQNDYGQSATARVSGVVITHDSGSDTVVPGFEIIKEEDEDKYTVDDYRETEDGEYRVVSNDEIRVKTLPLKTINKFAEDRGDRITEDGKDVIFAVVPGRYKEV